MTSRRDPARTFADYDIRSPLRSYIRVGRDLIFEPEAFFGAVRGGSLWGPTQFVFATYLLVTLIVAPIFLLALVMMFSRFASSVFGGAGSPSASELFGLAAPLLAIVFTPFFGVLGTLVGALIWHPFVALAVGVGRGAGFRKTYRIAAYQALPYIVGGFVPLLGFLASLVGMSYLGVFGVKGAHRTTTARAIISVVIPVVLTFLLTVGAVIVAVTIMSNTSS
jgi:hypothetical protein